MAFADTQHLVVQLDLKGNLNAKLGQAARAVQGFDKATSNTQRSLSNFGRNIERGVVVGIAATGTALLGVVKAAADYESAFAGVRKTVTATEPQLQELSDQFRALSKQIPISASELARLGEAGGALGVPTAQLKEFVRVTALLGVTTNLSADEAANSLGILGNVLHLTGEEYSKFASSLVALGNAGASTESDIIAISERIGAAGHLIGVSTQDILGFSSAVASLGIESEAGGTALQKFFIDSAKAIAGGGKDLKEFASIAGVSSKAFQKSFEQDASGALQKFLAGLGKLSQAKQLKVLEDLGFNDARITRTLLGLANNTKLVSDQMGVANDAFKQNTALTKEAEQRFNTFDSQLTITKNVLTDMGITIGSKLLPKITPLLKRLNEFVGANQSKISEFGDKLASGFEKFANAVQKVDWQPFIDGLRISSEIAGKAIKLFMSLPKEVQAAVIGGFAINKVTGGLGVALAKDVGGAVLGNLAQRGSSPANPLWVQSVGGGVPGVAPGGGGVLGALKTGVQFVLPIAVGVLIANAIREAAGITPEQAAAQNSKGQFGPRSAGNVVPPSSGPFNVIKALTNAFPNVAPLLNKNGQQAELDARRIEAAENRQIVATTLVGRHVSALDRTFRNQLEGLRKATKANDVAKFAKELAKEIAGGKGSLASTTGSLATLKDKLAKTHDPATAKILRDAIAKVEGKLPNRQFVQGQLDAAKKVVAGTESEKRKLDQLNAIQRSLRARGDTHAAQQIEKLKNVAKKVDDAKKKIADDTRAEGIGIRTAIANKNLSVTNYLSVKTSVSLSETIKTQTTFKKISGFIQS